MHGSYKIIYTDKETILEKISKKVCRLQNIAKEFLEDEKIICALVSMAPEQYDLLLPCMKINRNVALATVESFGQSLKDMPMFQNDEEIVLKSLKGPTANGNNIKYASSTLKNSLSMGLIAVEKNPHAYKYLSDNLKENDDIIIKTLQGQGSLLSEMPEKIRSQEKYFKFALEHNPVSYPHGIGTFKEKPEYIRQGLKCGRNIEFMPMEIQKNKKIVMQCVENDAYALGVVLPEFKDDIEVVLHSISHHPTSFDFCSQRLKDDRSIFIKACTIADALKKASLEIKSDSKFLIQCLDNGMHVDSLKHANSETLKNTELLVKAGIINKIALIRIIPQEIKEEIENWKYNNPHIPLVEKVQKYLEIKRNNEVLQESLKEKPFKSTKIKV